MREKVIQYIFYLSWLSFVAFSILSPPEADSRYLIQMNYEAQENMTVRYKYVLDYHTANDNVLRGLDDYNVSLFTLAKETNGLLLDVQRVKPYVNKEPIIPEYSRAQKLKKGDILKDKFHVNINPDMADIQEDIRFEAYITIEQLIEGKWAPVYQVDFMERGPYWSIVKKPM